MVKNLVTQLVNILSKKNPLIYVDRYLEIKKIEVTFQTENLCVD